MPVYWISIHRNTLQIALGSGLFVGLFLILFQPFGIVNMHFTYKYWTLGGFGLITFLVVLLNDFVLNLFVGKKYTLLIWQWILWEFWTIASIATANYLYLWYWSGGQWTEVPSYSMMLFFTLLIALFPQSYMILSARVRQVPQKPNQAAIPIQLHSTQTKDYFQADTQSLLFLESSDNYAMLYYLKEQEIHKQLLRITLTEALKQLPQNTFMRCHRSFIVNLDMVLQSEGNAQAMQLLLKYGDLRIPVSRRNISELKKRLG